MTGPVMVAGGNSQVATALRALNSSLSYEFYSRTDLNICNSEAIFHYFGGVNPPSLVINTAAYTSVDDAENNLGIASSANELGPELLAISCSSLKVPLVHLSTDYVFNGKTKIPYTEEANVSPLGVYGQTKLAGEESVRAFLDEHVILRLSGIFSSHAHCFPRSILKAALRTSRLRVVNDQISGPSSAHSVALVLDLIARRALSGNFRWGTYHFSQQPYLSWYEFAQSILQIAQNNDSRFQKTKIRPISSEEFDARATRPRYACLDSTKLTNELYLDSSILSREVHLNKTVREIIREL